MIKNIYSGDIKTKPCNISSVKCPYNENHLIERSKIFNHVNKCSDRKKCKEKLYYCKNTKSNMFIGEKKFYEHIIRCEECSSFHFKDKNDNKCNINNTLLQNSSTDVSSSSYLCFNELNINKNKENEKVDFMNFTNDNISIISKSYQLENNNDLIKIINKNNYNNDLSKSIIDKIEEFDNNFTLDNNNDLNFSSYNNQTLNNIEGFD